MNQNNISEAFEALKVYMTTEHGAKLASGGREIVKRCHFCGDSRDPSSRHLYIGLKDGKIRYNCFKCNAKGIVDSRFLRDINCYDTGLIQLCIQQNNQDQSSYSRTGSLGLFSNPKNLVIPISNNELGYKKCKYITERFGYIFTPSDAAKFKIVLNLLDFLQINGITNMTRHPDLVNLLNLNFLGFLSMDNRYIVLRRLIPEGHLPEQIDTRFVNYNITGSTNAIKYYTIPVPVNPNLPIDIHIAEGVFDILSVYLHVSPLGSNAIYSAICGKSYLNIVKFFISNYGFMNFNLHIYADADVDNLQLRGIKQIIAPFGGKCFIHRNGFPNQKDYGVSMDKIKDTIIEL